MYSYDRVLPIGSVVLLKGGSKRLMIIGYQHRNANNTDEIFDYCGCFYPEGYTSPAMCAVFNHDAIDRIISVGLQNQPQTEMAEQLRDFIARRENEQ